MHLSKARIKIQFLMYQGQISRVLLQTHIIVFYRVRRSTISPRFVCHVAFVGRPLKRPKCSRSIPKNTSGRFP